MYTPNRNPQSLVVLIFALCGYQPPYRSTFGHRGIEFGGESSQIWRQLVSETMGISTYRQTPSTLLDQHAHHGGFDSIDLLHSSIHNSINNRDTHIILYGMVAILCFYQQLEPIFLPITYQK